MEYMYLGNVSWLHIITTRKLNYRASHRVIEDIKFNEFKV